MTGLLLKAIKDGGFLADQLSYSICELLHVAPNRSGCRKINLKNKTLSDTDIEVSRWSP